MWIVLPLALLVVPPEATATAAPEFDTDIAPIFTRYGCNSGACHGAAVGRGGFRLSLYGSDPSADHAAVALQLRHRRVNLADPARSLIVLKPTGQFDHGGDVRFAEDSPAAERLVRWIRHGAVREGRRTLTSLRVAASQQVLSRPSDSVTLTARAAWSDGTVDDVTAWTVFAPDDTASVRMSNHATATVHRPGRHIVIARFLDQVRPVELILPWPGTNPAAKEATAATDSGELPEAGREQDTGGAEGLIDRAVDRRLRRLGLSPSPECDDSTFVRRAWLDLAGRLPPPEAAAEFVASNEPAKREQLVDRLLASDDFTSFWTLRFSKLLRVAELRDRDAARAFREWIHAGLQDEMSWHTMVGEMLTAEGNTHQPGPAPFFLVGGDPRAQSEFLSEALLGIRLRCANCHDHPLDRWTQDDYHGLTAVFAGIQRGDTIAFQPRGTVIHPGTGEPATPRIPGERFLQPGRDSRPELAAWMTSSGNRRLSTALVNRVWSWLMGRGLVEPVDDLRVTNPATHPELLPRLAGAFDNHGGDLRWLVREICLSNAWQRSSLSTDSNATDHEFCSHAARRELLPEVLLDAICDVTGVPEGHDDPAGPGRAVQQPDPGFASPSLDILGRCEPGQPCLTPETLQGLPGALALINGPVINQRLRHPEGHIHRLLAAGTNDAALIRHFYLAACSRQPTDRERDVWEAQLAAAKNSRERTAIVEDFVWSLLASEEFRTNH